MFFRPADGNFYDMSGSVLEHGPTAYAGGEASQACFEHDLDATLCYRQFALILTRRRLLHKELPADTSNGKAAQSAVQPPVASDEVWDLSPELTATAQAYTGVGEIELRNRQRLLARWHYTIGKHADACAFVKSLNSLAADQPAAGADRKPAAVLAGALLRHRSRRASRTSPPKQRCAIWAG